MGSHWQTPGGNRPQMTAQRPRCVSGAALPQFSLMGCLGAQSAKQLPQVNESKDISIQKENEALKVSISQGERVAPERSRKERVLFSNHLLGSSLQDGRHSFCGSHAWG